jgi:hypothetical protein
MSTGLPKPDAKNFGDKIREFALVGMGLLGNRMDAFVTLRMLKDAGVINVRERYLAAGPESVTPGFRPIVVERAYDPSPPPVPGGFMATAGTTQILLQTAAPIYTQGHGHARTIIYAANYSGSGPLPTFSNAVEFASFPGNIDAVPFDPASNLRLWAKWMSADGVKSEPAGGTNGIGVTTGLVDDQKIASMSAGKILAGSLAVGQYIQSADYVAGVSGWRIATLVGGTAFIEIRGNAVFGGTIFANAGTIGGITIGATYIRSTGYALNATGFNLNADGTGQIGGFVVEASAIRSSNYIAGTQGWRLASDGSGQLRLASLDAISANLGVLTAGVIRNSTDSVNFDFNAWGTGLMLRAGPYTYYGPYAGSHYKVEIYADGSAFFGREVVAGGTLKASGSYLIPDKDRPAIVWETAVSTDLGGVP